MRSATLALLLCLALAPLSFAQQSPEDAPASKQDIQKYFDAMHTQEMMKNMMNVMGVQERRMIHDQIAKQPNLPPDFEARMDKEMDEMSDKLPVEELIQAMIPAYEHHLTKGDVDALTAFYSSPRGQKILAEMPAMMAEGMQSASGIMQKMMADSMQRVQDEIAQLQKPQGDNSKKQPASQP